MVSAFWLATMSFENDALDGSKVSLNGFCICAAATERSRRMFDLGFISCDQEVVAFFAQRLASSDARGRTCDDGKRSEAGIVALYCH